MKNRVVGTVLILSLAVSGCVSTSAGVGGAPKTATAAALRQQQVEYERIQEGVVTGAVIGALIGAGIGLAAGGQNRGQAAALGGLLGAGLGGAAGGAYAQNVNEQTKNISAQKEGLQKVIAQADRSIGQARRINELASSLASEEQARINGLNAQLRTGKITAAMYRTEIGDARNNINAIEGSRDKIDADIAILDRVGKEPGGGEAAARANQLRAEKAKLETKLKLLHDVYNRVPGEVGSV